MFVLVIRLFAKRSDSKKEFRVLEVAVKQAEPDPG